MKIQDTQFNLNFRERQICRGHTYTKKFFLVYLKFNFNLISYIFPAAGPTRPEMIWAQAHAPLPASPPVPPAVASGPCSGWQACSTSMTVHSCVLHRPSFSEISIRLIPCLLQVSAQWHLHQNLPNHLIQNSKPPGCAASSFSTALITSHQTVISMKTEMCLLCSQLYPHT